MAKHVTEIDPHTFLMGFVFLVIAFAFVFLGPIIGLVTVSAWLLMRMINTPTELAKYIGVGSVALAMLASLSFLAWLTTPRHMTSMAYYEALPASIIHFITRPEEFGIFLAIMGAIGWDWVQTPVLWLQQLPTGLAIGSGIYLLNCHARPLQQLKRDKGTAFVLKKVGNLAASHGNKKPAETENGSVIGTNSYGRPVTLSDKAANQHTLVLGTTGTGKTVTICNIVESAIGRGLPLIYIDGKGDYELAQNIAAYGKSKGREVSVFAMRGDSVTYNPLATGGFTSKKDRIIELRDWSEEHYKKLAEGYLQCVFKVLDRCGIPCNMQTLAANLDLKKLKALVRTHEKKIPDAQALMDELNQQDQASKSIESLVAEIRNFTASEIGELFAPKDDQPSLTLADVLERNGIAYFCLPTLEFPAMSQTLGRLIINDLKATMAQQLTSGNKRPLYAVFDEFSVFAGEQVLNVINMGRSAGIHAVLSTQSLSDIASGRKDNADHFVNQVLGNCNNFILHRQNSAEDAEKLAAIIGTQSKLEYTAQVSDYEATHMGTVRRTRGFIAHPDEIKSLQTGEAYFISKEGSKVSRMKARMSRI